MDYAWGHNSIGVFEDEVKKAKKDLVGTVYSPIGTKDFSTYITKIRQSGADACFLVLQGDDNNAFLSQAHEYRLGDKVQLITSIVDLNSISAVGDAALGLAGSTRYVFTIDNPKNKAFVAAWQTCSRVSSIRPARCCRLGLRRQRASTPTSCAQRWRVPRSTRSRGTWRCAPATIRPYKAGIS
jgi:ABC-type branched-subunit amino acid transport system substrate-binding protein